MLIPLLGSGNAPKQLVSYGKKNETDIATGRGTWRQAPSHIMDQNLMDIIDAKMKLTIDNIE